MLRTTQRRYRPRFNIDIALTGSKLRELNKPTTKSVSTSTTKLLFSQVNSCVLIVNFNSKHNPKMPAIIWIILLPTIPEFFKWKGATKEERLCNSLKKCIIYQCSCKLVAGPSHVASLPYCRFPIQFVFWVSFSTFKNKKARIPGQYTACNDLNKIIVKLRLGPLHEAPMPGYACR